MYVEEKSHALKLRNQASNKISQGSSLLKAANQSDGYQSDVQTHFGTN
jgi:hypothetical protein